MPKKESPKSFLLRLDAATMEKVEAWAAQDCRSVNGQLQWIIAEALRRHGREAGQRQADDAPPGQKE